ncbi:unnamed protein product [Lampetra planeri]
MALAMAAYPDATADHLDLLILSRMLELSQELNISLPVCGHEPLTSRWVARCLDAKFNIKHWDQMAAWTGKPEIDGPPLGWSPRLVVHCSDDSGDDDMLAAAVPHRVPGRRLRDQRGDYAGRQRAGAGSSDRRPTTAACFKCGRRGHFARDCRCRPLLSPLPPRGPPSPPPAAELQQPRASRHKSDTRQVVSHHSSTRTHSYTPKDNFTSPAPFTRSATQWKKLARRVVAAASGSSTLPLDDESKAKTAFRTPQDYPDFSQPFILDTDASDIGIGAVLSQRASCDQRVGSTHLQLDREGRLRSELRPAGRLDSSSARPGGSTQERAATSGSARLIFSSSGTQPSSIGSPEPALGARLKRLPISSAGGQDPLDSSTRHAWVNLCRVGGLCCRRSGEVAVWRRGSVLTLVDDPTLHAASELWAPPTDRVPNCDSVSTGIRTSSPR